MSEHGTTEFFERRNGGAVTRIANPNEQLLQRAEQAERELAACRARADDLRQRLEFLLNAEPDSEMRATTWTARAENAEHLLAELMDWLVQNPSIRDLLPPGFPERLDAQLRSLMILRRDQRTLGEKPPPDEVWTGLPMPPAFLQQPPMREPNGGENHTTYRVTHGNTLPPGKGSF